MVSQVERRKSAKKGVETKRVKKLLSIEESIRSEKGFQEIAGVDEVGRGPLAGPVVAAACILPKGYLLRGINDSKQLDSEERYKLYQELILHADVCYGVGIVEPYEIDELNIHNATLKAMAVAIARLTRKPDYLLVDGKHPPKLGIPCQAIVDGDRLSCCIAAASVIAKVTRDHIMMGYHDLYPLYRFNENKGYGTAAHLEAIQLHGPCPIHRMSFGLLKREEMEEAVND